MRRRRQTFLNRRGLAAICSLTFVGLIPLAGSCGREAQPQRASSPIYRGAGSAEAWGDSISRITLPAIDLSRFDTHAFPIVDIPDLTLLLTLVMPLDSMSPAKMKLLHESGCSVSVLLIDNHGEVIWRNGGLLEGGAMTTHKNTPWVHGSSAGNHSYWCQSAVKAEFSQAKSYALVLNVDPGNAPVEGISLVPVLTNEAGSRP